MTRSATPAKTLFCRHGRVQRLCTECRVARPTEPPAAEPELAAPGPRSDGLPAHFPYATARSCQVDFIHDGVAALHAGKPLLVHAPTGTGKTISSLVAALEGSKGQNKRILFLTNRKTQRKIVVQEARRIAPRWAGPLRVTDLAAKRDMCVHPKVRQATDHAQFMAACDAAVQTQSCRFYRRFTEGVRPQLGDTADADDVLKASKAVDVCPYEVASERVAESEIVVLDYNHVFSDLWDRLLERTGASASDLFLIVDEAHNLVERVRAANTAHVHVSQVAAAAAWARSAKMATLASGLDLLARAMDRVERQADETPGPQEVDEAALGGTDASTSHAEWSRLLATDARRPDLDPEVAAALRVVSQFLIEWHDPSPRTRFAQREDGRLVFETMRIDPRPTIRDRLRRVGGALLMSGTLYPTQAHRESFGVAARQVVERAYGSPFPGANRPVEYHVDVTSRYGKRSDAMFAAYAEKVVNVHSRLGRNVAAFFPSYHFARQVYDAMDDQARRKCVRERAGMDRAGKNALVDRLLGARDQGGMIFLATYSGSFGEGVDFRDNLLGAVMLCGLPLATWDPRTKAVVGHYERTMGSHIGRRLAYEAPALTKAIQAAGRGIRSETDVCEVHFLDSRYADAGYQALMPPDLRLDVPD